MNSNNNGKESESDTVTNDCHSNNNDVKKYSSTLPVKPAQEAPKKHKSSFLSQFRKKFSFKKSPKQTSPPNKRSESGGIHAKTNNNKENLYDNDIKSNRYSLCTETAPTKDDEKKDKRGKHLSDTEVTSAVNKNMHPPRYSYLASFGWYWGPLSRAEATHRLRHKDDGSFLVRESEGDPNKFTLSFKGAGQIFHNRILRHGSKYAFLPDEEFDSIPALIEDAMRRSKISAYCFSRSTDVVPANHVNSGESNPTTETVTPNPNGVSNGTVLHKHEVRLLHPVSRYENSPRSLYYLCRFMIRQYCGFWDLDKVGAGGEILNYLKEGKYYL